MKRDFTEIERKIVEFAKRKNQIIEVSRGVNPEEGNRAYFLHTAAYDFSLADEITELDIRLLRQVDEYFDIFQWPANADIERTTLYKRTAA